MLPKAHKEERSHTCAPNNAGVFPVFPFNLVFAFSLANKYFEENVQRRSRKFSPCLLYGLLLIWAPAGERLYQSAAANEGRLEANVELQKILDVR
jgi:hypothetical protein